jgi:hypothetical protein
MSFDQLEGLLARFMRSPFKSEVKIDFDKTKQIFQLSAPIYRSGKQIPSSILNYVDARKEKTFQPHKTSFCLDENLDVRLVQEIPFQWGFQPTMRQLVVQFLQMAKVCNQMLLEMAAEEKLAKLKESKHET